MLWPIFVKDTDGWMYILRSADEVQAELEEIDISDKEYIAWDSNSLPLELYLDREKIKVRIISDEPKSLELKEAILNYANLARPKVRFVYSGSESNIRELFEAVEKHISNGCLTQKLKRLFCK